MKIIRAAGGTGAGLLLCGMLLAQLPEYAIEREKNGPDFYYSVISMAADSSGRSIFEIHVQMPYDELQFVQSGDVFRAEYEISLTFFDLQGEQAEARIIKQEVFAYDFKETNSLNAFSFLRQRFEFVPGKYDLLVSVMDMDNQLASRRKSSLILPDYHSSDLEISDLLIADRISTDSAGIMTFFPNVLANMDDFQKSLLIWFEVYNRLPGDSIKIAYQIFDYREKEQRKEVIYQHLKGWRTPVILVID